MQDVFARDQFARDQFARDEFTRDGELNIPDPGYDVPRRREAGSNRRMALIAGSIGVGLLVIGGGLELASRRSNVVPVIAADSRPIRVRPENPGGMQVIGANEMNEQGTAEALAPPPEAPDTRALRAQQQAELAARQAPAPSAAALARTGTAAPDVPLPPVTGSAGPASADGAAPPAPARIAQAPAVPATPRVISPVLPRANAPAPVQPAVPQTSPQWAAVTPNSAPPAAVTSAPVVAGHKVVQLAAVASEEAATAEWDRLSKRMPELLGGRRPEIIKFERDGHVFWRVRTAGFSDTADASAFCGRVRAKGANCAVF